MLLTLVHSIFTVLLTSEIDREKGDKQVNGLIHTASKFAISWDHYCDADSLFCIKRRKSWKLVGCRRSTKEQCTDVAKQKWSRAGLLLPYALKCQTKSEGCLWPMEELPSNNSSKKTVKRNNTKCLNSLHNYLSIAMPVKRPDLLLPCQQVHMGIGGRKLFSSKFVYFT